jgi:hypothetical protein
MGGSMSLFNSGIRPQLDEYIAQKLATKRNYGKYWSASSAGYCMRLNILKRLDIPAVPEIAEDELRTQRVFECGHVFHEWIQRITKETGLSIAQELELQDEDLLVRGHIDDLVLIAEPIKIDNYVLKDGGVSKEKVMERVEASQKLVLYDYKTANSISFNYKRDEMGHYHKMQLGTYMHMLRKHGQQYNKAIGGTPGILSSDYDWETEIQNLDEGRILTISKDDLRMREQQIFWSPQLEKQIVDYWRTLQGYWDKKVLPPCTCLGHDGGFMGKRSKKGKVYNSYFYNDTPCSEEWINDKLPEDWKC